VLAALLAPAWYGSRVEWQWLQRGWSALVDFLLAPTTLLGLTLISVVTFVVSLIGATWAVRRLPVDYLLSEPDHYPLALTPLRALKNLVGVVLFVLGVIMLVLPGQGLLTIIAALALMDFRGKRRLERRLMLRPRVFTAINRLRLRAGQPRLLSPDPSLTHG
jgi:hypothetical protein